MTPSARRLRPDALYREACRYVSHFGRLLPAEKFFALGRVRRMDSSRRARWVRRTPFTYVDGTVLFAIAASHAAEPHRSLRGPGRAASRPAVHIRFGTLAINMVTKKRSPSRHRVRRVNCTERKRRKNPHPQHLHMGHPNSVQTLCPSHSPFFIPCSQAWRSRNQSDHKMRIYTDRPKIYVDSGYWMW